MSSSSVRNRHLESLLQLLRSVFDADLLVLLLKLGQYVTNLLPGKLPDGLYEVLEYEARLELLDVEGKRAVYHKRQQVRFLQDNVIAYQDKAWGDGNFLADYRCSPGVPVDRYQEGYRWHILISLRETKNKGDVAAFHIERAIEDGFTQEQENFQFEIDHVTRRLSLGVVFPPGRLPGEVVLVEQNATRSTELEPQHKQVLPDGRLQVVWKTDKPRRYETYILRWKW